MTDVFRGVSVGTEGVFNGNLVRMPGGGGVIIDNFEIGSGF